MVLLKWLNEVCPRVILSLLYHDALNPLQRFSVLDMKERDKEVRLHVVSYRLKVDFQFHPKLCNMCRCNVSVRVYLKCNVVLSTI